MTDSQVREIFQSATTLTEGSLLQATPIYEVLKLSRRVLGCSAGNGATYHLSQVSKIIDSFVSHNWSTGRYIKFMTLALHFEYEWAFGVSACMTLILMVLSYLFRSRTQPAGPSNLIARTMKLNVRTCRKDMMFNDNPDRFQY